MPRDHRAGNKLTLRIPPAFTGYIEPFIQAEMKRYGKKRRHVPAATTTTPRPGRQLFGPAWEKAGGKIVGDNPMSYNKATDFYSGVSAA